MIYRLLDDRGSIIASLRSPERAARLARAYEAVTGDRPTINEVPECGTKESAPTSSR